MGIQVAPRFFRRVKTIQALPDLAALIDSAAQEIGFDYFALLYAARQTGDPADTVKLTSFPEEWVCLVNEREYWVDDPVFAACERAGAGFEWHELPALLALSRRQRELMEFAYARGLKSGFTVPIPRGSKVVSLCSFACARDERIDAGRAVAAQAIGWFAFEAARRICAAAEPGPPPPGLTQRQLDCLVLYAQGKSDGVIGQLLGISRRTANEHMEIAKRRHGVATRQQLLSRVLWHGQLSFADILD